MPRNAGGGRVRGQLPVKGTGQGPQGFGQEGKMLPQLSRRFLLKEEPGVPQELEREEWAYCSRAEAFLPCCPSPGL